VAALRAEEIRRAFRSCGKARAASRCSPRSPNRAPRSKPRAGADRDGIEKNPAESAPPLWIAPHRGNLQPCRLRHKDCWREFAVLLNHALHAVALGTRDERILQLLGINSRSIFTEQRHRMI